LNPYILENQKAWSKLSEDHYHFYKARLKKEKNVVNPIILQELGDLHHKSLMHLQCNIGQDSVSLAHEGALVTGCDLSKSNIDFARRLAFDFNHPEMRFFQADLMEFPKHDEKYDVVFTSEGVLGWLPDLNQWAKVVASLLKGDGFFYINEIHPFFSILDEDSFALKEFAYKYPYFNRQLDKSDTIGGYASGGKTAECYYWMFSVSDVINALIGAGLEILYFHEFDRICYNVGGMEKLDTAQYQHPEWLGKLPMQFSIKAKLKEKK